MSWKGFQKAIVRAPQKMKGSFNMGDNTKDPVYVDAERRFNELVVQTKKLHVDSKKYAQAINDMFTFQIEFSKGIAEIYQPISGQVSNPDTALPEGNPEGIRACAEYESVVKDIRDTLEPEIQMLDTRVIQPAEELLSILKVIHKTAEKRERKRLDYDRHRSAHKKLQDKKEKSLKDEKSMYETENNLSMATQEFEYYNEALKNELPLLFKLESEFIKPLFRSFYFMQLNIFYTLYEKMKNCDIGYFDLSADIEKAFEGKRGDVQERAEALAITKFRIQRTGCQLFSPLYSNTEASTLQTRKTPEGLSLNTRDAKRASSDNYGMKTSQSLDVPPPYSAETSENPSGLSRAHSTGGRFASSGVAVENGKKIPPLPPIKPKPLSGSKEYVTALYDYVAQASGDLSFSAGDKIEVIKKTNDVNEWWTGRLNGVTGIFPGNYVTFA
ncbi:Regulator of cytoskeleton and endocytosis RVS167 [Neolecta irregularis DAH-3]|uniref:Regulator of cytoskeleton and endocytosis RVS167 n=1 Tax=Neolecta irregularis (strain DAH-3) TaxID=1198029 RepID=A0A1U7LHZ1_NEOID|nr:Regulator of cytoskeleton and endocytosis RVS167 [Neolecta irregularis DAH-3]|eukprot:OLL22276.1 Regulator of cytoskeleton and endocytosis RVS167 [Neolecta irregularis DAH-3]